jgi:hypothetical protein
MKVINQVLVFHTSSRSAMEAESELRGTFSRSSLSASMAERELVWKTRTWLITFILELDVASGTGLGRLTSKLMKLNNTHSTHIKGQGEWIVKEFAQLPWLNEN